MTVKSIQTLVSEAMQEIKTINADEAFKMVEENNYNLIFNKKASLLFKSKDAFFIYIKRFRMVI